MNLSNIRETVQAGDAMKWELYNELDAAAKLRWRLNVGHREFVRLQRLHFHGFI